MLVYIKCKFRYWPILGCVLFLFLAEGGEGLLSQTINLEGDVWEPYVMNSGTGKNGFMVDIAYTVFKRAGYKINFKVVPWQRALEDVRSGITDGAVGIYFTQARSLQLVVPSEELGISVNKFYVQKESAWKYIGSKSLETQIIGVIAGYDYGSLNTYIVQLQQKNSPKLEVVSGNQASEKNIKKLISGRITVTVEDDLVMKSYVAKLKISDKIKEAGMVSPSNRVGIAFSSHNPKSVLYARVLSEGIQKLRKSGELKKILDKYSVKDWKK